MSAFTGRLTITHLDLDWRRWKLETTLRYEVGKLGSGRIIEVPAGFVTDGASVPRILWSLFPAWGRYSRAAVVHDFLCDAINCGAPHRLGGTRAAADRVFLEAMAVSGVGRPTRLAIFAAVRAEAILLGKP